MGYIVDSIVYLILGAGVSWFYFYFKRLDLIGGFIGGFIVALIGGILGTFILQKPLNVVIDFLQNGLKFSNVNLIAAIIGAVLAIWLFSQLNQGRIRKEY